MTTQYSLVFTTFSDKESVKDTAKIVLNKDRKIPRRIRNLLYFVNGTM